MMISEVKSYMEKYEFLQKQLEIAKLMQDQVESKSMRELKLLSTYASDNRALYITNNTVKIKMIATVISDLENQMAAIDNLFKVK